MKVVRKFKSSASTAAEPPVSLLVLLLSTLKTRSASKPVILMLGLLTFSTCIAGTGIGAFLAAMLSADDGTGHPIFTAREAVKFIAQNNSELFKVKKLAGVFRRRKRFSGKSMDKVLKEKRWNVLDTE
ncbi:hypothetical protein V6N13_079487 [Hibiscus sabdariffa]